MGTNVINEEDKFDVIDAEQANDNGFDEVDYAINVPLNTIGHLQGASSSKTKLHTGVENNRNISDRACDRGDDHSLTREEGNTIDDTVENESRTLCSKDHDNPVLPDDGHESVDKSESSDDQTSLDENLERSYNTLTGSISVKLHNDSLQHEHGKESRPAVGDHERRMSASELAINVTSDEPETSETDAGIEIKPMQRVKQYRAPSFFRRIRSSLQRLDSRPYISRQHKEVNLPSKDIRTDTSYLTRLRRKMSQDQEAVRRSSKPRSMSLTEVGSSKPAAGLKFATLGRESGRLLSQTLAALTPPSSADFENIRYKVGQSSFYLISDAVVNRAGVAASPLGNRLPFRNALMKLCFY